jgi:hypothetical protein
LSDFLAGFCPSGLFPEGLNPEESLPEGLLPEAWRRMGDWCPSSIFFPSAMETPKKIAGDAMGAIATQAILPVQRYLSAIACPV